MSTLLCLLKDAQKGGNIVEELKDSVTQRKRVCVCVFHPVDVTNFLSFFRFSTELNSGLLEVISPPAAYYPELTNLKETFGDSRERVK